MLVEKLDLYILVIFLLLFSFMSYGLSVELPDSYEKALAKHYGVGGEEINLVEAEEYYLQDIFIKNTAGKTLNLGVLYSERVDCDSILKSLYLFEIHHVLTGSAENLISNATEELKTCLIFGGFTE